MRPTTFSTSAMRLVARLPIDNRTMTALVEQIGASIEVREALRALLVKASGARCSTGSSNPRRARVVGVEVGAIVQPRSCLWSSRPSLMRCATSVSGWLALGCDVRRVSRTAEAHAFRDKIDRLAREIRKQNGVMVLATQNPAEMTEELAAVVDAQCPTRILTQNPDVLEENRRGSIGNSVAATTS